MLSFGKMYKKASFNEAQSLQKIILAIDFFQLLLRLRTQPNPAQYLYSKVLNVSVLTLYKFKPASILNLFFTTPIWLFKFITYNKR